ncbi:YchJ family protein [Streptomyces sp. YU58]|uniref:YchJ family protein n=1 Tax=Streptomyces sp. SX92 TaxID=3158972 RepID=UPI0027B9F2FC|nr:YchJ family metal-binding protein [Streptomyces coralus]WLW56258.1 YchJ family metal-binding protein [Streptomyces coralus]
MSRRASRSRQQHGPAPARKPSCPCGLAETYDACCGRFHRGEAAAPTAESLMRSRYSAFVKRDEAYLLRTWHPRTRPPRVEFDPGMRWTGLEILATGEGTAFHATGTVTFRASFKGGSLHERSRFERIDGAWVYVHGEFLD